MDDKEKYLRAKIAKKKYQQTEKWKRARRRYYEKNKYMFTRYMCILCKKKFYYRSMDLETGHCIDCVSEIYQ